MTKLTELRIELGKIKQEVKKVYRTKTAKFTNEEIIILASNVYMNTGSNSYLETMTCKFLVNFVRSEYAKNGLNNL